LYLAELHCSGHNSYLEGNQLTSTAGIHTIETGLKHGCRVVELDVYDGTTEPVSETGTALRHENDIGAMLLVHSLSDPVAGC